MSALLSERRFFSHAVSDRRVALLDFRARARARALRFLLYAQRLLASS